MSKKILKEKVNEYLQTLPDYIIDSMQMDMYMKNYSKGFVDYVARTHNFKKWLKGKR